MIRRAENIDLQNDAYWVCYFAFKFGVLSPSSNCSICGKSGRTYGHHEDYAHPLDVIWVCSKCHKRSYHYRIRPQRLSKNQIAINSYQTRRRQVIDQSTKVDTSWHEETRRVMAKIEADSNPENKLLLCPLTH